MHQDPEVGNSPVSSKRGQAWWMVLKEHRSLGRDKRGESEPSQVMGKVRSH